MGAEAQGPPPRVVLLADSPVVHDGRLLRAARTAARAGYDVVVLGSAPKTQTFVLDGLPVLLLAPFGIEPEVGFERFLARWADPTVAQARRRSRKARGRLDRSRARAGVLRLPRLAVAWFLWRLAALSAGLRAWVTDAVLHPLPLRARTGRLLGRRAPGMFPGQAWRELDDRPTLLANAWLPQLRRLRPDLIHALGTTPLPAAGAYVREARAEGRRVALVQDNVSAAGGSAEQRLAAVHLQRAFLPRADAVVTASEQTLPRRGRAVVLPDAPETEPLAGLGLRQRCHIGKDVPLVVCPTAHADLPLVLEVLVLLPDVHLAVVVPDPAAIDEVLTRAEETGVRSRVHPVRALDPRYAVALLRGADAGVPNAPEGEEARQLQLAGVRQAVAEAGALRAVLGAPVAPDVTDSWSRHEPTLQALYAGLLAAASPAPARPPGLTAPGLVDDLVLPHTDGRLARHLVVGPDGRGAPLAAAVEKYVESTSAGSLSREAGGDHVLLHTETVSPVWRRALEREVVAMRTHVLLEGAWTLDGFTDDPVAVATQVRRFEQAGLQVGLLLHDPPDARGQLLVEWLGLPTYTTGAAVLDVLPWATLLPADDEGAAAALRPFLLGGDA